MLVCGYVVLVYTCRYVSVWVWYNIHRCRKCFECGEALEGGGGWGWGGSIMLNRTETEAAELPIASKMHK